MTRNIISTLLSGIILMSLTACGGAKLATADEQYERGEYYDASKTYRKVYNKLTKREERPQRGEVAFKMGLCHDKLSQSARASAAFQNAIRYEYADSTAYLLLGKNLQAEAKYAQAIEAYSRYLEFKETNANKQSRRFAENGIAGCRQAIASKGEKTRYVVKNAKLFNSRRSDFAPMYFDKSYDKL